MFPSGLDPVRFLQLSRGGDRRTGGSRRRRKRRRKVAGQQSRHKVQEVNKVPRAEFLLPGMNNKTRTSHRSDRLQNQIYQIDRIRNIKMFYRDKDFTLTIYQFCYLISIMTLDLIHTSQT